MRFLRRWRRERQASTKIIELKLYTNCSSMNTSLVSSVTHNGERRRILCKHTAGSFWCSSASARLVAGHGMGALAREFRSVASNGCERSAESRSAATRPLLFRRLSTRAENTQTNFIYAVVLHYLRWLWDWYLPLPGACSLEPMDTSRLIFLNSA